MSVAKSLGFAAFLVALVGVLVSMVLGYSGSDTLRSVGNAVFFYVLLVAVPLAIAAAVVALVTRHR